MADGLLWPLGVGEGLGVLVGECVRLALGGAVGVSVGVCEGVLEGLRVGDGEAVVGSPYERVCWASSVNGPAANLCPGQPTVAGLPLKRTTGGVNG